MKDSIITNFTGWFVRRWRVSLLMLLGILVFGYASYSTLLKREGFPPIAIPIVVVNGLYQVNDSDLLVNDLTIPLEAAVKDVEQVKSITSTSNPNFASLVVELEEGVDIEKAQDDLSAAIDRSSDIPVDAKIDLLTINAGAIDGESDFIFSLYNDDEDLITVQAKAKELANKLASTDGIKKVNVSEVISEGINPFTGEAVQTEAGFNRVGVRNGDSFSSHQSVAIGVAPRNSVGTIELSELVRDEVTKIISQDEFEGFDVAFTGDFAPSIAGQISDLESNLLMGLGAVLLVVYLLVSFRSALITILFIPLVVAGTFASLYLIGYTLNTLTLFAVILVLGLIVDDAIVVVEAVEQQRRKGIAGLEAIKNAINEIGVADIAGTATTVLVFAPMAFISGILGQFIILIPTTVIIALILSLLIALTIVPVFSNWLLPVDKKESLGGLREFVKDLERGFSPLIEWKARLLERFTRWYLGKVWRTILVLVASLAIVGYGFSFASKLEFTVFPETEDADEIFIQLSFDDGTSLSQAKDFAQAVDSKMLSVIGSDLEQIAYFGGDKTQAVLQAKLIESGERETAKNISERLKTALGSIAGVDATVSVAGPGPQASAFPISVEITGDDVSKLETAANQVEDFLSEVKLSDAEITETKIANLQVNRRVDGKRVVDVKAKISEGADTNSLIEVTDKISQEFDDNRLSELGLDSGSIKSDLGQESENLESFESAGVALAAAMLLLYGLLVVEFDSFLSPFLILLAVPFGFSGVFPGLFATSNPLSFFVMIGAIALAGITVNNTIMILELTNQHRRAGLGIVDSVAEAIRTRFRPVVATSITTIIALLPLALADPFWESLSYTLIFGLIASTTLIIVSFPAYYGILEGLKVLGKRLLRR
ncbi:efflux RND transporter permease subunit [Candidatus Berkelbacteria bacterium]|nr:efflux RND transporter permease subunit [Candidatus Berkelbacteria bacterium]